MADEVGDWVQGTSGTWLRALHGLLLRVRPPGPGGPPLGGPWTWEVAEATGRGAEHGVGRGGADTREAAMARAEAVARAHARWRPRARWGW